jgi:hypothetical protein
MIPKIQELCKRYNTAYYEKLDINACRKYSFAKDFIHVDDGITLFFGSQIEKLDKAVKGGEKYFTLPLVKLEINPNKHADKPVLKELLEIIRSESYDARILRYDYAIDIPKSPDDVQVFSTNKEKGLFKGTRYFGQRNKNGFTRIYDKQKEQGLDSPLTRVETVVSLTKGTKNISFEKVYVKNDSKQNEAVKLTKTDEAIIELCELLRNNGLDYEKGLEKLEPRKKRFIREQLGNTNYNLLELDKKIIEKLLKNVMAFFDIKEFPKVETVEKEKDIQVDADGFCLMPDDMDLPFD